MKRRISTIIQGGVAASILLGLFSLHAMVVNNSAPAGPTAALVVVEGIAEGPAPEPAAVTAQPAVIHSGQSTYTASTSAAPLREASAEPVEAGGNDMMQIAAIAAAVAGGAALLAGAGYFAYQSRTLSTDDLLEKKSSLQKKFDAAKDDPKKQASIQKDIDKNEKLLDAKTKALDDEKTKLETDKKALEAKVMAADQDNPNPLTDDEKKRLSDTNTRLAEIDQKKKIIADGVAPKKSTAVKIAKAIVTGDMQKLKKVGSDTAIGKASTAGKWTTAGSYTSGDLRRDASAAAKKVGSAASSGYSRAKAASASTTAKPAAQTSSATSVVKEEKTTTPSDAKETTPKPTANDEALSKLRADAAQKAVDVRTEQEVIPKKTPPPPPSAPKPPVPEVKPPKTQTLSAAQQTQKDAEAKRTATALKPLDIARMGQKDQGGFVGQAITGRL